MTDHKNEGALVKAATAALAGAFPSAWIFKIVGNPMQMIGVPDVLVLREGVLYGLEFKHRKAGESEAHARGRASAHQLRQIERIRKAGGVAEVVLSVEEALEVVARLPN